MKTKIIFLLIMATSILKSCSQSVPKVVDEAFLNKFVGARDIVWERNPDKEWIATFYMEKFHYMTAYYTKEGKFDAFEIEIHENDIPDDLASNVYSKYPNATIFNVFEKNMALTTDYIFEVENEGQLFGIYYSDSGASSKIPPDDYRFTSRIHIEND